MANIKDVARESGFSVTTVSRAFNNYSDVNQSTKAHILAVAKRLDYTPNINAKNLVMQKSSRIGFVVFDFGLAAGEDNFVYELMIGMQRRCIDKGFDLLFLFGSTNTSVNTDVHMIFQRYDLCGLVIMGCGRHYQTYRELQTIEKPVAFIDGDLSTPWVGSVSVDNYAAAREAVSYLTEKKRRSRILVINGKQDSFASMERLRGCRDVLGPQLRGADIFYAEYSDEKSYAIVETLFESGSFHYDAVFATSDMMAIGVENALLKRGIRIGEDVDIIGFDNIPISAFIHTPLTTVAQDKIMLGEESINMLLGIMDGESETRRIVVPHRLIQRSSA